MPQTDAAGVVLRLMNGIVPGAVAPSVPMASSRIQRRATTAVARPGLGTTSGAGVRSPFAPVAVHRSADVIRRWEWWDKRKAAKEEAAKAAAAKKAEQSQGSAAAKEAAADAERRKYKGKAGKTASLTEEVGKPTAAISAAAAGAAGMGAGLGTDFGAAGGMAVLSPLLAGDSALGMYNASKMQAEGAATGDKALGKLGDRKMKDQSAGLGMALVGTSKAGVEIAKTAGAAGAVGAAAAGLGVAAGSAMVLQGAWRGGKAVMALCRLTWGRGQQMLTHDGDAWKDHATRSQEFKVATNALKIAVGALGIAAGALLIASNPVGWAIGIAAGIAGGIYAISKIAGKISNAKDKQKAAEALKSKPASQVAAEFGVAESAASAKGKKQTGTGFSQEKTASADPTARDRERVIEQANGVARLASENARVAHQMRQALSFGDKDLVFKSLEIVASEGPSGESVGPFAGSVPADLFDMLRKAEDRRLHDAFQILSSINVNPDEALSDSGQDLIEKKLSKAESM